jgi:hypothetical protein
MKNLLLISLLSLLPLYAADPLERYFGGMAEAKEKLVSSEILNASVTLTEEMFTAKDTKTLEKEIKAKKLTLISEGKVPREFLEDPDGRLFDGLSQTPIKISILP